jgi:hypothetical protein
MEYIDPTFNNKPDPFNSPDLYKNVYALAVEEEQTLAHLMQEGELIADENTKYAADFLTWLATHDLTGHDTGYLVN